MSKSNVSQSGSQKNLVLIGMPGAGKSTIGVLLAKRLGLDFLDTDILIQNREGMTLQEIVDSVGPARFRQIEEQVLGGLRVNRSVIATGGSAVYGTKAMLNLSVNGLIIYLSCPLRVIEQRVNNHDTRGLARTPGQTLEDLFRERAPLYGQYADITVEIGDELPEQVVERVVHSFDERLGVRERHPR